MIKSQLKRLSVLALTFVGFSMPVLLQAETSASVSFSNMYLWRGQNLTPDGAAVSGSLDYGHPQGIYAGIWGSSEENGIETDLYAGWGKEFNGVSVDVSYWKYLYPDATTEAGQRIDLSDNDYSEAVLSLGYGFINFTGYFGVESGADSDNYYTLTASKDKFSIMYGLWDFENPGDSATNADGPDEYSHIQLGYAATENLSFALSFAFSDNDDLAGSVEEDPLFLVSYGLSFDLQK